MITLAFLHGSGTVLGKGQYTIVGTDGGRQFFELLREAARTLAIIEGFALYLILAIVALQGELDGLHAIEQLLIPLAERQRIDIYAHRLGVIHGLLGHATCRDILGVELEVDHRIARQNTRLKDFHLVLDTSRITHKTKILHVGQHLIG